MSLLTNGGRGEKRSANEEKASAEVAEIKVNSDGKQCRENSTLDCRGKIPFFQNQNP